MDKHTLNIYGHIYFIPDYMIGGIDRYVNEGIIPGGFLSAVICNDLKETFGQADDINFHNVPAYVNYFYNYAPSACWGSKEKMFAWEKLHKERRKRDDQEKSNVSGR